MAGNNDIIMFVGGGGGNKHFNDTKVVGETLD